MEALPAKRSTASDSLKGLILAVCVVYSNGICSNRDASSRLLLQAKESSTFRKLLRSEYDRPHTIQVFGRLDPGNDENLTIVANEIRLEGIEGSELCGLSCLQGKGSGEIRSLFFTRSVLNLRDARQDGTPCLEVLAGDWRIEACRVRIAGGIAMQCVGLSSLHILESSVGGTGTGIERARHALTVGGTSQVRFCDGDITECLGAVIVMEKGKAQISGAKIQGVSYAFGVDHTGILQVSGSAVKNVQQGVLVSGNEAEGASMLIQDCRMEGVLWFGEQRPGECTIENIDHHPPPPRESDLQHSKHRAVAPPHDQRTPWDRRRGGERPGSCYDFG